ncbi:retrotransposon protein, putative, ty1-copia subclass [Tanacetum coccineum]
MVVMAQPVQNINHSAFRSMFEREKLSGNNFNDWFRQLKLVLRVEKKMFVSEQPLPAAPAADSDAQVLSQWNAVYDAYNEVACLIFGKEGKPVAAYVIQMKGYVDQLERLGYMLPQDLIVGLILNGLTKDFTGFVRNYNMQNMGKTIGELHAILIEPKRNRLKLKAREMIKKVYIPKPKNPKPFAKEHPTKDDTCHHCKDVGYWKRNCHVYLDELLKKKKQVGSATSSGFREARKLKQGALYLYVGNGVRAQVEAIGSYDLVLPNGLVIYFRISVSKNNVFYFNAIPSNGIYEIDMHDLVPNVNSIYNVSTKRAKHNLDSTYLWHCRLAHISKKRIEKLQQEGLLKSTDDESFDQCVSCLSGKMTRKSFPHRPERATDLLGIIHTDVCGPLRHVSRQGASYFITFTDDYSRYGYVYLLKHKHELTPPYTPQHNGVSERRNRTLLDMVRSMMNLTTLPLSFWDYALESATRILNMVPTKKVDKTPYELWYGKVPNLSYLKVWGCEALVKRDTPDKLQQRSVKCIFIGYPKETMGYYFYFPPENKIVVARYAEFFEKNLITQEVSGRAIDLEEIQDEDTSPSEITSKIPMEVEGFEPPQEEVIPIRRSERTHRAPDRLCLNIEEEEHDNMVWVLVDLPPNCKTVRSKWIFKKKTDMDGIVHTYKARLVAKGYTQLYGVDYEETFSPVADIRAIRILISIAAYYDYEIWQMDVKTAFLNGYLDEDIYMVQPEGFVDPNHPRKVCKLQRSIYGLKQASRSWNKRFDEEIKKFSFAQNLDKPCVYQKASGSNVTFLILYVDDIIIMGSASTPKEVKRMQNVPYASAVGSIMYAVRCTRPDVVFAQIITSRFQQNPGKLHWTAVKNILKYLRNTKDMFLVYGGNPEAELRVDCYCDAGFETDRDDIKSQTGYVFILNEGALDCKRSKQSTIAMSVIEAKYIATSEAAMEAVWIRKFISGLGIVPTINEPIRMFCDNSAALHFANEPGVQRGARHYHRRYHYVRESIALGEIRFLKVHTDDNLADPFTKALSKGKLTQHARSMGLRLASSFIKSHKVLEIASAEIIDRQLPFEYTITSISTDVVVMAQPVQNINHSAFRSMFEREKLFGNNFNDWFRQLKLVLRVEKKMFVIEQPLLAAPAADSDAQVQFENSSPYDMIKELKAMFEKQVGVERFDLIQTFHACKQEEGKPVDAYVIWMKGYVDQLERLGYILPQDLIVGLILNGLTKDFARFMRNYNMHNMGKTIGELHAILIKYEKGLPRKAETPQVMMIKGGKIQKAKKKSFKAKGKGKANGKGNDKQVYIPKPKNPKPSAKEHPAKDDTCHHCKEGFREVRKLKQGELYLYVGNDVCAQVEAIGSYELVLPNGLVICLDNCHYAPSITRGVVSVHHLVENGFVQCFTDFGILVSKNNVFYFNVIPSNGIYEIDMHDLVPNVNSIYNVSTKRAKHNLDSTYLWHCRLAHISKKRIEKLQQEGILRSTDDESFDQCVSCLSSKMTRKSFPHRPERATDLLEIIHTDVCGPLRHVSRQGASYFIIFTDDYSHYGYLYLLKHEVFDTFKVFKNEVKNQLGKTIKALR